MMRVLWRRLELLWLEMYFFKIVAMQHVERQQGEAGAEGRAWCIERNSYYNLDYIKRN